MTKIADFFIEITAKGDLKELKQAYEIHKAMTENATKYQKQINAYLKLEKKENINKEKQAKKIQKLNEIIWREQDKERKKQAKEDAKKPKTLKELLIAQGKLFSQQNRMNGLVAKGVLQTMGLSGAFMAVSATVAGAIIALDKMIMKLAQANQLYTNFSRQTGLPMQSAMGLSGAMANLDFSMTPQDIMSNMQQLQSNLVGIQFGMGNIAPYQIAGIQAWGGSADAMLETIRKKFKRFAPEMRTFLLQQMGLDPRLGVLSDLSDTEFAKLRQDGIDLYLTPEDRKRMQEFSVEWNKAGLKVSKTFDKFILFFAEHTQGLAKAIQKWSDIVYGIFKMFFNENSLIGRLLHDLITILKPLYWIIEDIAVWLAGGKSAIGSILSGHTNFFGDNDVTKGIGNAVQGTKEFFGGVWDGIKRPFINNSSTNKNFSMNNNINIHATDQVTGLELSRSILPTMNTAMATLTSGGY